MLNDRVPVGNGKESWSRLSSLSFSSDQFGSSEATWKFKFYEGALGWYKSASGFFISVFLCLIHGTNHTQIVKEPLITGLQHAPTVRFSEDPKFLGS